MLNFFRKSILLLSTAFLLCSLFSCASISAPQISYVIDSDQPYRDDSFINELKNENDTQSNKIAFIKDKKDTVLDYLIDKNIFSIQNLIKKTPLICYGDLSEVLSSSSEERLKPVVQKLIFHSIKKKYLWTGFTEYGDKKYDTRFYITVKGSGEKRQFIVKNIDSGTISMKLTRNFGYVPVETPCKIAVITDSQGSYAVYAVKNNNYRAFGKDSYSEAKVKRYMPKISTRNLLNLKDQKFQFVTADGSVLAESGSGQYKIFAQPEDARAESLVQAIALTETYINVMNQIDALKPLK